MTAPASSHPPSRRSENELLFDACRIGTSAFAGCPPAGCDWAYVERAAVHQGVAPLVHQWLSGRAELNVPGPEAGLLHDHYWLNHFRNRKLLTELARLMTAGHSAGIELIPLKGADLAARFYPRPALRPMSDIDLLVRSDDLESFRAMLPDLGYEEFGLSMSYVEDQHLDRGSYEHKWQLRRDDIAVLLEFRAEPMEPLVNRLADLDPALSGALRDHTEGMWTRLVDTPHGRRLSVADLFLHVAAHLGAKHAEFRLIWLHDLARIAAGPNTLDWRGLGETAATLQVAPAVRAACSASARLMGASITGDDFRAFDDGAAASRPFTRWEHRRLSRHVDRLAEADLSVEQALGARFFTTLGRLGGLRPRLRALRWAVLPSRDYLVRWPDRSRHRLFVGYAGSWLRRSSRALSRLLRWRGR